MSETSKSQTARIDAAKSKARLLRRRRILEAASLDRMLDYEDGERILLDEAADDVLFRLVWPEHVDYLLKLRKERSEAMKRAYLSFTSDDVIIIPGFFASSLRDVRGKSGVIWLDAKLFRKGGELSKLALRPHADRPGEMIDLASVQIEAAGPIPATVELLQLYLSFWRYAPSVFAFDWRKSLEIAAKSLADHIRARISRAFRPLHLVAHSIGCVVARRALQLLGTDYSRRLVQNLVLLGPLTRGSCSPAQVLGGDLTQIDLLRMYGIDVPADFDRVLQTFPALYQLLPYDDDASMLALKKCNGILGSNEERVERGTEWLKAVDTQFFDDRTTIILGDKETPNTLEFRKKTLAVAETVAAGDGVVTDARARLPGVRTYRLKRGEHSRLLLYPEVHHALRAIFKSESPKLYRKETDKDYVLVSLPELPLSPAPPEPMRPAKAAGPVGPGSLATRLSQGRPKPPAPATRRLRVFSFDPLLATSVNDFGIATFALELPWEDDLTPGPIGEYLEVIDYDPASQRFYHPVDLSHPRVIAQDGLAPAESNPQFHQQMVYAVAQATINEFEHALGRVTLWAPRIDRGRKKLSCDDVEFVPRLRIYPHGLREANAYYQPEYHAILFGYFSSREQSGGQTIPGGTVFTCQSYDIIAHETTHALLHGLHRYYLYPSNRDVLAFHEAIADAVALFQKFGQEEVLRSQIARTRGDLRAGNLLGNLAQQFGAAMGSHRGALRQYVNRQPDSTLIDTIDEPHDRGALLMGALFRAFLNIYENRTRDLYRIATNGTGKLPDGDIHPDLVCRLATEASRSARHMLRMCVRALDYVPPVDLTFGEYLRALITADFELVRNDDRGYRVSVLDAFRSWGIYPADVNVLDESAILWDPPGFESADVLADIVRQFQLVGRRDRRTIYSRMRKNSAKLHEWLSESAPDEVGQVLGLQLKAWPAPGAPGPRGTPRSIGCDRNNRPKFEVHSVRTCLRIGPDGQRVSDVVIEIVQRRAGFFDPSVQETVDLADHPWAFSEEDAKATGRPLVPGGAPDFWFRGGCTLIIDQTTGAIRYCIGKSITDEGRLDRQRSFERGGGFASPAATYFGRRDGSPFALLHCGQEDDVYGS